MEQYKTALYIIGGASTALEIRETIDLVTNDFDCIVNVIENGGFCRYSFVEDKDLNCHFEKVKQKFYIIGFSNQKLRKKYRALMEQNAAVPINVIHPTAFISSSALMGVGNFVSAYAVISSEAIVGNHNLINIATTIGHNSVIGNDNIINPGAKISGCVKVGDRCLFGANSFVYQGTHLCSDCAVDAMTYLNRNIEEPSICTSNIGFKIYKNRMI
ncbi:MAG: acetyltransferase [Bacteroidales bacterium]|nr:acetyltransferase [Bacteroidales bacterium]